MIATENLTLAFGQRVLFKDISIQFAPGNCYGLIGANGSGKSSFLKILSGELEATEGMVHVTPGERLAVLKQNQFEFDAYDVMTTVIMGHRELSSIMQAKELLYNKASLTDEEGMRLSDLEGKFADMNGWTAESDAAQLLSGLGVPEKFHYTPMKDLESNFKVRVLLAQALFGNPDILLLDEPTNHLDPETILWLEEFLAEFRNTVIVVSHDRHFLDQVCTRIADIDFGKIQLYTGNYSFWYEASQLALKQQREQNRKADEKKKDLLEFIQRFSANASKNRQATARKKMLEKLNFSEIPPSTRKYPHILFQFDKDAGSDLVEAVELSASSEGALMFKGLNLEIRRGEKVAFVGRDGKPATTFFEIITGNHTADAGNFKWGAAATWSYFPKDSRKYFETKLNVMEWLQQFSKEKDETYIRGFLGKMLFSGDESLKPANVLSGGEKVRCLLAKMMAERANVMIMDEPTNHLDLESITSLNNALINFKGTLLFTSQDHQFIQTVATRIVEITPRGTMDRLVSYDDYISREDIKAQRAALYA